MKSIRTLIYAVILAVAAPMVSYAASLELGRVYVKNIGLNKRLVRVNDSGIILEDSGMCLEVSVDYRSTGLAGSRVVCLIHPLDAEGNMLADRTGEAVTLGAVTIPSSTYSGTLVIPMPYQWILADKDKKQYVSMGVSLVCMGDDEVGDDKIVTLTESEMQIDRSKMSGKMMTDVFGSPSDIMGSVFGSIFGGSDAEATHPCTACDGTGICPYCDGDAYFDPASCRKCSSDHGICRRCNGKGTVTVELDFY